MYVHLYLANKRYDFKCSAIPLCGGERAYRRRRKCGGRTCEAHDSAGAGLGPRGVTRPHRTRLQRARYHHGAHRARVHAPKDTQVTIVLGPILTIND